MRKCEVCNTLQEQINHLQGLLTWYRDENRSLLNRLLITVKVPPIMQDEDKETVEEPKAEEEPAGETYGDL